MSSKSVISTAIKAEIRRHESLQSSINRLSKQLERVADQQLRSGLKLYLHSIQGKPSLRHSADSPADSLIWFSRRVHVFLHDKQDKHSQLVMCVKVTEIFLRHSLCLFFTKFIFISPEVHRYLFISQPLDTGDQLHHPPAAIAIAAGWNLLCGLLPVCQSAAALKATSFQTNTGVSFEAHQFDIISSYFCFLPC